MSSKASNNRKEAALNKSKARKLQRKEERAQTNQYWQLVEQANKVDDPLEPLISFQNYEKNGLNIQLACKRKTDLKDEDLKWVFNLTKRNMEDMYESSWGWNDKEKMNELYDDRMWFLIARQDGIPVAFSSFRFDLDFKIPVLYCYEIQLSEGVTRKGLGTFMMQVLQLLAMKSGMHKVMATILHCNEASSKFFMNKLRYQIDETSLLDKCYDIVCKPVKR